jgi:hypothetical protein
MVSLLLVLACEPEIGDIIETKLTNGLSCGLDWYQIFDEDRTYRLQAGFYGAEDSELAELTGPLDEQVATLWYFRGECLAAPGCDGGRQDRCAVSGQEFDGKWQAVSGQLTLVVDDTGVSGEIRDVTLQRYDVYSGAPLEDEHETIARATLPHANFDL